MSAITADELRAILAAHGRWFRGEPDGKRANLTGSNLTGANLTEANLTGANLTRANLTRANLTEANLTEANLTRANLTEANLTGANLTEANLTGANLTEANLTGANLTRANLTEANLTEASLTGANLGPRSIVPETGSFEGWKKVHGHAGNPIFAHLRIPAAAGRVGGLTGRKCRAEYAEVLALETPGRQPYAGAAVSGFNHAFAYVAGETVRPDAWNPDIRVECAQGIHFFLTRQEALDY